MNSVTYDWVRVLFYDEVTLDGVAGIKSLDIYKYSAKDEARWRRIASRFGGPSQTFRPHYFVIARTVSRETHPTMLQLLSLGNGDFDTVALGRKEKGSFDQLQAVAIWLLRSERLHNFATLQAASTNMSVGLFLKL